MAYIDSQHVFSQAQAPTTTFTTESYSTNTFDLTVANPATSFLAGGNQIRYLGFGTPMWVNVRVSTAVTSAGAATVTFSVGTDAQSPLAAGYTSHIKLPTIPKATLIFGYCFAIPIPADTVLPERYLGVGYLVNTADLTAGAFTAWLDNHPAEQAIIYKSGLYQT